ncbi:MAG: hypothetical protein KY468_10695 [Armatimonadetes bacterium]|nr:hypothetical protein [Armatimonadota bacterium]
MTIGDVLAVVAGVFGVGLSVWALLVGVAVMFGSAAHRGKAILLLSPFKVIVTGLLAGAVIGFIAVALMNQANGALKLAGIALLLGLLAVSALGGGGLATIMAERVRRQDGGLSPFAALGRGAALLVIVANIPFFGWFLLLPVMTVVSLGLGIRTLFTHSSSIPVELRYWEWMSRREGAEFLQGIHEPQEMREVSEMREAPEMHETYEH